MMDAMTSPELLTCAQRLQAIAQAGLAYATSPYDVERYEEVRLLSARLLHAITSEPFEKIIRVFASETGYQTPKVDVRAVLFRGVDQVLLVKETIDQGRWTLPGGWADVGYTPFEVAAKEALEETGLVVKAVRLLALLDTREHPHPPQPWYVYKVFIRCEVVGGSLMQETSETSGARWFRSDELPTLELSTDRVTHSQLDRIFQFAEQPELPALCD
jgi:ADP-ribose pyrophosphatase YjhB (NUDIX family)